MPATNELDWVNGGKNHLPALRRFVCADPEKALYEKHRGKYHPRPWELEVQSSLRNSSLPVKESEIALLAIDTRAGEIASVCHFGFDETGDQFMIWALATSANHKRQGLGMATLERTLGVLGDNKEFLGIDCGVFARIHPLNEPSRSLFRKAGFECLGQNEGALEMWVAGA